MDESRRGWWWVLDGAGAGCWRTGHVAVCGVCARLHSHVNIQVVDLGGACAADDFVAQIDVGHVALRGDQTFGLQVQQIGA